jgi:hypothetical protein
MMLKKGRMNHLVGAVRASFPWPSMVWAKEEEERRRRRQRE